MRTFEDKPAVRERVPLLIGIVGPSSSGKTFSALRLAAGIQRVVGREIFCIDTEHKRATFYTDRFKFRHVDFAPPHGPLDYLAAVEHCVKQGAGVIVIDSMTHEHSGDGGVLDQSEKFLDDKCGQDFKARERMQQLSWVRPKQQRKKLNRRIVQLGVNAVFCYRADEKIQPVKGEQPVNQGWQPETTSKLHYDMVQRFLLTPGCDGVPDFFPDADAGKRMVKTPAQFRDWFKPGVQLSEDIGERLARWAAGDTVAAAEPEPKKPTGSEIKAVIAEIKTASSDTLDRLTAWIGDRLPLLNDHARRDLFAARDEASKRLAVPLTNRPGQAPPHPADDGVGEPPAAPPAALFDNASSNDH